MQEFFSSGKLLHQWSCTTQHVKDFRPVACCTVAYKIISKILTARLGKVIGEVIDPAQAGFIPGKHIGAAALATELMKGYSHKYISPRCMIKIDLRKAYDSIEWPFLATMLEELGFPRLLSNWIMACVTSVSYSVLINGIPSDPFPAKKGLRQGKGCRAFSVCHWYGVSI